MNPSYLYFKELDIDRDNVFHLHFSKENEMEEVVLDKDYEYAITGLNLNVDFDSSQVIKIEDENKQKKLNAEILQALDDFKEPDLALTIQNDETVTVKIPFVKKKDLPLIKYSHVDLTTKKKKEISVYDYVGHFDKYGFEWRWDKDSVGFKYEIKKAKNGKIEKKIYLKPLSRKKIVVDESRMNNMKMSYVFGEPIAQKRLGILSGYLWVPREFHRGLFNDFDFTAWTGKRTYVFRHFENLRLASANVGHLVSGIRNSYILLCTKNFDNYLAQPRVVKKLFVPKFYHDRASTNFLKYLRFVKRHEPDLDKKLSEHGVFGRAQYEYQKPVGGIAASSYPMTANQNPFFSLKDGAKRTAFQSKVSPSSLKMPHPR